MCVCMQCVHVCADTTTCYSAPDCEGGTVPCSRAACLHPERDPTSLSAEKAEAGWVFYRTGLGLRLSVVQGQPAPRPEPCSSHRRPDLAAQPALAPWGDP